MFSPTPNPRTAPPSWRAAVRRAVDLAVAFATLESYALPGAPGPADVPAEHPHRAPLTAQSRERRPGAGIPRPPHCAAPLPARSQRRTTQALSLR